MPIPRKKQSLPSLQNLQDDGLFVPEIRPWSERKLRVCWYYDRIFSTGMKKSAAGIAYIDLFTGAGYGRISGTSTSRVVPTSALLSLDVPNRFSKYVFCEKSLRQYNALVERVRRHFPDEDVSIVHGDCNERAPEIAHLIPRGPDGRMPLAFCFVDPNSLGIHFKTLTAIVRHCPRVDFLVLLALGMDAMRNRPRYIDGSLDHVDLFLDDGTWRERWKTRVEEGIDFRTFLVDEFMKRMKTLGYMLPEGQRFVEFKTGDKDLPLYHLAFFSKHERGYEFWDKILPYAVPQGELGL